MRIIYFTDTFLPQINGVVTSVVNFSKQMAKRGHTVHIFTTKQKNQPKINIGKNIYIHYFPSGKWIIDYPDFRLAYPQVVKTMRMVRKIKPDIIHVNAPSPHAWTALMCAKINKIPIMGTYHTLISDFLKHSKMKHINMALAKRITWQYTRSYYNKLDLVVAPSGAIKKELKKNRLKKKIEVVSNGVDTTLFYPMKIQKEGTRVLHVGRISYEKNIDVLLKAFKILLNEKPDATLDIVGIGPNLEELKDMAEKMGLEKNVRFLGKTDHEKLREIYNAYDIFVTASTIETEGLVVLEAMACGLPIVGVDRLALSDIIKHDSNGLLAKPGDEREIAMHIKRIMNDDRLRQRMGENSARQSKGFALEKSVDLMEGIYQKLIKKKRK